MVNLKAFIEALKSTWIRRLPTKNSKWQVFIKANVNTEKLTGCNIMFLEKVTDTIPNQFWKDVLQSLININKKVVLTEKDILRSPIYYNYNIKLGEMYIYYNNWFKKGIRYINDLIDENGVFYSEAEFTAKTGIKTNFLQYNGLIEAIKKYLKHIKVETTHKESCPFIPFHISTLLQHKKGSKIMYNTLNKSNTVPTGQVTWNKVTKFSNKEWKKNIHVPFPDY